MTSPAMLDPPTVSGARPLLRRVAITALSALLAGIVLAALGPFGSYMNAGAGQRLGYWVGAMLVGSVLYGLAFRAAGAISVRTRAAWAALIAAALIASVPQAIVTRWASVWLWPELRPVLPSWGLWFGQTAMIGVGLTIGVALALRWPPTAAPPTAVEVPARASPTLPDLGPGVLALEMEDHYVRVHRGVGSSLHLMTLTRAIELAAGDGLRVHRSWWVAAEAVAGHSGDARQLRLHLTNALVVPVARSAVTRVRAAGWLDGPRAGG